jgi:hypothetical protein
MKAAIGSNSLKLSTGGLFYSLLVRSHSQTHGQYNTRRRIIILSALSWLPLLLLSAFEGNLINHEIALSFINDLRPYVRYLIAIPILIVADTIVDPLIAGVIRSLETSGILPSEKKATYKKAFEILDRRNDSIIADIVIIGLTILATWGYLSNPESLDVYVENSTWVSTIKAGQSHITYAGWWFLIVSSPLLQIILYRWLWRFLIWCEFMYRVSRIDLTLEATHPDMSGGLGALKNSQNAFVIIFLAFGTMLSVSLAQEILYTDDTIAMARPVALTYITICLVITTLPLLFFARQIIRAKLMGRIVYGAIGYRLSRAFDEKWANKENLKAGKNLMEGTDSSAVCDYADIYEVVKKMRIIPVGLREYIFQALILAAPFAPLVLLEMPLREVVERLLGTLI